MESDGNDQNSSLTLRNENNPNSATTGTSPPDQNLTILQPPLSQSQIANSIPSYPAMLPSFGHYTAGKFI